MVTLELDKPEPRTHYTAKAQKMNHFDAYSGDPYNHTAGEQAMWRSVIVQALMDAASLSQKPENQNHRRQALIWLRGRSEDFSYRLPLRGAGPGFHARDDPRGVGARMRMARRAGDGGAGEEEQQNPNRPALTPCFFHRQNYCRRHDNAS